MRAVKGEVTSSNPISLSKAAAVLSRFAASETGARPDVAAYLRRTAAAFNELVAVHREIRAHRKISHFEEKEDSSRWKEKRRKKKKEKKEKKKKKTESNYEGEAREEMGGSVKKKKKVKALGDEKRSEERGYWKEDGLQEVEGVGLVSESVNTEKKKRKRSDAEQGEVDREMERQEGRRKNKRRTIE